MSTTDSADTPTNLIELQHSWLLVPHDRLHVSRLAQAATPRGVMFTAALSLEDHQVGIIHNAGNGGPTHFIPREHTLFTSDDMEQYAQQCQTPQGTTVTTECVLDTLVDAYECTKFVRTARRRGRLAARLLHLYPIGSDIDGGTWEVLDRELLMPAADQRPGTLAKALRRPEDRQWWQQWKPDEGWFDVTPRPDET